jgi:hypothetical protein
LELACWLLKMAENEAEEKRDSWVVVESPDQPAEKE